MNEPETRLVVDRRDALRWMALAAATLALPGRALRAADINDTAASPVTPDQVGVKGYGTDPNLLKIYQPGDLWPLTLDAARLATAAALCDVMLPEDKFGPSASSLQVHVFIDEWISAPYPGHAEDRKVIFDGLVWLEEESQRRFHLGFSRLPVSLQQEICDDICHRPKAKPEFQSAASFFRKFQDLAAAGYYTTPQGMRAIGYVGNVPTTHFEGPPRAVLERLGLV